jgi:hypothetical protein
MKLAPGIGTAISTIAVLAVFILSWRLFEGMNPYESLMPKDAITSEAPITLGGVEASGRRDGFPSWRLQAANLVISPDRRSASANGLSDGVFFRNGQPALYFSANHLRCSVEPFSTGSSVDLSGGVGAWTDGKLPAMPVALRLSTKTVTWNERADVAICSNPVYFYVKSLGRGVCESLIVNQALKTLQFGPIYAIAQLAVDDLPKQSRAGTVPSQRPSSTQPSLDNDTVSYSDDAGGYWDENNSVLTMNGKVIFHQGAAEVNMTGAVYDRKTDTATSSSPVTITDTDTTVMGNEGIIDFATHLAILKGHVVMSVIPKPTDTVKRDQEEAKKPTTILCDQINYDYRAKMAKTTGQVTIKQKDRTVTADDGRYDVAAKIIYLVGNIVGKSADGKTIQAPEAEVSVDESDEWIKASGPIEGIFTIASQENPLDSTSKKPATASKSASK